MKEPRRRATVRGSFHFSPVSQGALWGRLELTGAQLSVLTGISRRQVQWWRQRGYLPPSPEASDRYSGNAVEIALLMKQAVDAGPPVRYAHEMAVRVVAERLAAGVEEAAGRDGPGDVPNLADLAPTLRAVVNTVEIVLLAVDGSDSNGAT